MKKSQKDPILSLVEGSDSTDFGLTNSAGEDRLT
jgi:hypothetical protein